MIKAVIKIKDQKAKKKPFIINMNKQMYMCKKWRHNDLSINFF
jgi:hypothetical protein